MQPANRDCSSTSEMSLAHRAHACQPWTLAPSYRAMAEVMETLFGKPTMEGIFNCPNGPVLEREQIVLRYWSPTYGFIPCLFL
jgi:hypothetical protein